MEVTIQSVLEKVATSPGQGNILEQVGTTLRKQQRTSFFQMVEKLDSEQVETFQ